MTPIETFRARAPGVMDMLMSDFGLNEVSAAAILGNLGHESNGFATLQEKQPMIQGSRGGWGWAQWTASRRRAFEAYCLRNDLNTSSDKANYGFLFIELETTERKAIPAVKAAVGLEAKVEAFEKTFLRAGVKHYPSRILWAKRALDAWEGSRKAAPATTPAQPTKQPPTGLLGLLLGLLQFILSLFKRRS